MSLFTKGKVDSLEFRCPEGFTSHDLPKTSLPVKKKAGKCCGQ